MDLSSACGRFRRLEAAKVARLCVLATTGAALIAAMLATVAPVSAAGHLGAWAVGSCDTPADFYSSGHVTTSRPMCCANRAQPSVGVCPDGVLCPGSGVCPTGDTCVPLDHPHASLPNVVVVYSDDQAYCQYGFMGTCRTDTDGTPVPAPYTPALDDLATRGKVFTVAHNVAHWCLPSRDGVLTGRLPSQRGCAGASCRPPGARSNLEPVGSATVPTIAQLVKNAGPGYCTYQIGKGLSKVGFDAVKASRRTGRTRCSRCGESLFSQIDPVDCQFDPNACPDPSDPLNEACASQPKCGEDDPTQIGTDVGTTGGVQQFLDDMVATGTDGKQYLPKKFMVWVAPSLPHTPTSPADVIEHRPHATDPSNPDICRDFLFGYLCDQPTPGGPVQVLGPRFPFGAPAYASKFASAPGSKMQGLYGNVYWLDSALQRLRKVLASHVVETATGPQPLSASTVILFMSDNGGFLPRSKKRFTENGFRTPLIVYDPRHETPPGDAYKVETDIGHSIDILPTVLSYAGAAAAKPAAALGKDLRGWLENPAQTPTRQALCGTDIKSLNGTHARYLLPRGGSIGSCSAPTGTPCAGDGDCTVGAICGADGQCAVPTRKPCVDDDDCRVSPSDPAVCRFQERKWCSGDPTQACTTDAECRTTCQACTKAPSRACTSNLDCGTFSPCIAAPADELACTCGLRRVKLYDDEQGLIHSLTDLLTDPDESALVDNGAVSFAAGTNAKLTQRLRCCLDAWWVPPGIVPASCPTGCDARVDCTL